MRNFAGNERFEVISRLGTGGMGAVFHVFDRERRARMALKTVGFADGEALLRFKREYRSLQDLEHPNLIQLGELFESEGEWFYTMELVEGTTFLRWCRPNDSAVGPAGARAASAASTRAHDDADDLTEVPEQRMQPSAERIVDDVGYDELRLRRALAQLAGGLAALHASGKVHRDIKPSNVLVSNHGRVVLLDFGLVAELRRGEQRSDVGVMGTYPYMSPEQAAGKAVGPAADWYAMGVMLFQALTGVLPFRGATDALIYAKLHETAPEAKFIEPRVPPDLNDLARDLLQRDPEKRPSARAVLERLHVEDDSVLGRVSSSPSGRGDNTFVGRKSELAELRAAFELLLEQRGSSIVLAGESGIGKSELLKRFLELLEERHPTAVVLSGRCYERESVPFRSFDGIVDALSGHLARHSRDRVERFVPRHRELMARVFPVLRRVDAMRDPSEADVPDPQEKRARLFVAFRTLFAKLGASDPVVVTIEDLQWIDDDSRVLLEEVLREPSAPPLLLIATQRTAAGDERSAVENPQLRTVRSSLLTLKPLADSDAVALVERLLADQSGDHAGRVEAIVRESRGHPLLVDQLAHHARAHLHESGRVSRLEDAIRERLADLSPASIRVLRTVCVAGSPTAIGVVAAASGTTESECEASVREMRKMKLVRSTGSGAIDVVEPYHSRIADAVLLDLGADAVIAQHRELAMALEARPDADPVDLVRHHAGAGQRSIAARHAVRAAERASEMLAFDRAASLYRQSLALDPAGEDASGTRRVAMARALANAGRGKDAAEAYLAAAEGRSPEQVIELQRRAAEQFLLSGHVSRGIDSLRVLLRAVGVAYPDTMFATVVSIVWVRLWLLLRRNRYTAIPASAVDPYDKLRLETCHSAALGLTATDTIRGLDFYGRSYQVALRIGDEPKIAQLLATDAVNGIAGNGRGRRKAFRTLQRARDLAEAAGDPYARGVVAYAEGMGHYLLGEWQDAVADFLEADRTFREECAEAPPEFRTLQACVLHCYFELGDYHALETRASRAVKEAEERGDIFTEATLRCGLSMQMFCMLGDAERGYREATRTIDGWTGTSFDVQRYMYHVHSAYALMYLDRTREAHERMQQCVKLSGTSMLAWVQLMRAGAHQVRGLTALARAAVEPENRTKLVREALRDAKRMASEDSAWSRAGATVLRGNAHALLGERAEALVLLGEAATDCENAKMIGRAAACRWAAGFIAGDAKGLGHIDAARGVLVERGVRDPDRYVRNFAPVLFLDAGDRPWASPSR